MQLRILLLSAILASFVGCVSVAEDATPAASTDATASPPALTTTTPIAVEGETAPGGGVCVPVRCVFPSSPGSNTVFPVGVSGTITNVSLTLTWEAVSPASEELVLGIAYEGEDGETWEYAAGPSPLTLALSGLSIPAEGAVIYVNAYVCQGGDGASACASGPSQAFRIEGDVVSTA